MSRGLAMLASVAGLLASTSGGAQAMDAVMRQAERRARSTKSQGRTIHGPYDGQASNGAANTKRALKRTIGARQLKKLRRRAAQGQA